MKVVNVRINGMENPVGFDFETVCVSWKVRETSARRQQNVKIEIALTEDFSELLWTKEGKNLNSAAEKLEFEQSAYTRYYVRVTVTSDEGETAVSKPAYFETGKMDDLWMGKWITTKKEDKRSAPYTGRGNSPGFRTEFCRICDLLESSPKRKQTYI